MNDPFDQPIRRREHARERTVLSTWHFGSHLSSLTPKRNNLATVNAIGSRYALHPSPEDAETLIRAFHRYLMKYVALLSHGKTGAQAKFNFDTRRFLSLFIQSGKGKNQAQLAQEFRTAAARLPNAFLSMDADDIYNEMVILFLELAQKFNPDIGGFTGYIQHHFRYALKKRMLQVQYDALNHQPLYESDWDTADSSESESRVIAADNEQIREYVTIEFCDRTIDLPILNLGFIIAPPDPFGDLWTRLQRTVVVYRYFLGETDSAISKTYGLGGSSAVRALHDEAIEIYLDYTDEADPDEKA